MGAARIVLVGDGELNAPEKQGATRLKSASRLPPNAKESAATLGYISNSPSRLTFSHSGNWPSFSTSACLSSKI